MAYGRGAMSVEHLMGAMPRSLVLTSRNLAKASAPFSVELTLITRNGCTNKLGGLVFAWGLLFISTTSYGLNRSIHPSS